MQYRIKTRQREAAKRIGVTIRPSSDSSKKLDVFKNGFLVARIGDINYPDYATYLQQEAQGKIPQGTAEKRKALYRIRHASNYVIVGTPGYYAHKILWT